MVLGLGDGAGGGEGRGVGGGGRWQLQQRHGRLYNDNQAISRGWKCLLLWRILILFGGAFEKERARKKIVYIARSEYHTQLANMSFDKIFDPTAGVYFDVFNIM